MEIEMFNFLFINNNYNAKFYLPQVWRVSRLNWECPFPRARDHITPNKPLNIMGDHAQPRIIV